MEFPTTHLISPLLFLPGSFSEASFAYTPAGKHLYSVGFRTPIPGLLLPRSPLSPSVSFPHSEGLSGSSSR
jgi:hypothetical protein